MLIGGVQAQAEQPSTSCTWGTFSAANQPGACWRPYSTVSPFNRPLPSKIEKISKSAAVGARTARFGKGAPIFHGGVAGTSNDTGHALYFSRAGDPMYTVRCTKNWGTCDVEGLRIAIPADAKAATGDDGHLGVIDQVGNWEYDFWQVNRKRRDGGILEVSWGGRTRIGTSTADGLGSKAVAAGYGLTGGVIRPEELAAGKIDHALFMTVKCTNGRSVWPAADGTGRVCKKRRRAPAMGAHFFLSMTPSEVEALSVPDWQKAILRAMVTYGMFVGDTGARHAGWTIKIESGTGDTSMGYADPWVELGKRLGLPTWNSDGTTLYSFDLRNAVRWRDELRVARPCVARRTC